MVAITCGSAFSAVVPATDCDTYAASDFDTQRKASGVPFDKIDSVLAVPACERAVRKYPNSVRLIYQLGRTYAKKNDFRSAFVQYQKAANQGYVLAEYNLGVLYERGWGVAKDEPEAVAWYRKAAEQGFASAQSNLGNMYRNGQAVAQDYAESLRWLHKAADQGDAHALVVLGVMYEGGQGVPQDYIQAVNFYRKAAEQGDAHAQTSLGNMYGLGQGLPQDYIEAAKWFRLAADQGYANAQYLLGLLYEHGDGVPKNFAEGAKWYRKAANQGNAESKSKLADISTDRSAGRAAQEAGSAALHKALAEGSTKDKAWEEAAQAASLAAVDVELAAGRDQEVANRASKQIADQVREQSSKAPQAPPNVNQEHRTPGSGLASKRFMVAIEASASGGARPIITGTTNLPDGTHLWMALNKPFLPNYKERLAAGLPACEGDGCGTLIASHENKMADEVVVRNGGFSDGPFSNKGAALSPGIYVLDVYNMIAGAAFGQPPDVLEILGQHGENLSGSLVNGCCVGLHFGQPPEQIEEAREKQRRSQDEAAREGFPPTFVLYQRYVEIGPSAASASQGKQ